MFSDDESPEWNPQYASKLRALADTPPSELGIGARYTFFLGILLAQIHKGGNGYSDLHPSNVGILPSGGLILVDPGGFSHRSTTPQTCAGDFVVPCLEFNSEDFAAFWQGYLLESYKFIDPLLPNFCSDLRHILFGLEGYDPLPYMRFSEIIVRLILDRKPIEPEELESQVIDATLLLLAISSTNWEYKSAPNISSFLALIDQKKKLNYSSYSISLEDAVSKLGSEELISSAGSLQFGRPLSTSSGMEMLSPIGRPASALLGSFINSIIEQEHSGKYLRMCLLLAILALVKISRTHSNDAGTALTYCAIAFSIAGSTQATLEELQNHNLACWRIFGSIEGYTSVGPHKVSIPTANVGLELSILFHKAACSDWTLLVKTLERAITISDYEPAWQAGISSIDSNRKCLLMIFYTLLMLPAEENIPSALLTTLLSALQYRMCSEKELLTIVKQTKRSGVETVLGGAPDFVIKGAEWAKEISSKISVENLTVQSCLQFMGIGREYFSYVTLEVDIMGNNFKHSRQDIFFGFAQALDEDRIKHSSTVVSDNE